MNLMMTSGVKGWAKLHGTESLVFSLAQIAAKTATIMREPITLWTIWREADCVSITVDGDDKGEGRIELLNMIDGTSTAAGHASWLWKRFFMKKITKDGATLMLLEEHSGWPCGALMLPEEY